MIKVAVLGTGRMGDVHAKAWNKISNVRLAAVCGRNRHKAFEFAELHHTMPYYDFDELLENSDFDVLDICLPTYLHKEYVIKAAAAKKHIIVEKPIGLSAAEGQEMIEACKTYDVKLFVAHVVRFFPEYSSAYKLISNGAVGRPRMAKLYRGSPFSVGIQWYSDIGKSGGIFMDLMIHDFDWIRWTFGEVVQVTALRPAPSSESESAFVSLLTEDGTISQVTGLWSDSPFFTQFEISGDEGMISNESKNNPTFRIELQSNNKDQFSHRVYVPENLENKSPYQLQLEHFIDCLLTGKEPIVSVYDAIKAVQISEAAILSIKTGQPVELDWCR